MLMGTLAFATQVQLANAQPPPSDVLNAINRGYGFIDRYWSNMGGVYYVTKEHPGVPLAIYNSYGARYFLAGAQSGENDHTSITTVSATQYRIYFESGTDWDRNDVSFLITYTGYSTTQMKADIKMETCSPDGGGTITTYFNGASIGTGCWVGTTKSYISPSGSYGWKSFRYVHRHSNNLIQSLYAAGKDITKAKQLQEGLLVNDGFSTDVYDPFYWRAGVGGDENNYGTVPFPDTFTLWDRTWWDWFVYKNGNWETEFPRVISGTSQAGYPYKSRILGAPALNDWTEYLFTATVLYDAVHAMRDMSKGNWNQAGFDKNHVRAVIDQMGWDGTGTRKCLEAPYNFICYPGYPTYNTAVFLAAATMFYYATGETAYKTKADQAAQWLVNVNVASRYVDSADYGLMDRPDAYGGFLTGYTSGSTKWKEIASHGFTEAYFWLTEQMGWYSKMKAELGVPVIVSMEPTALAVQALTIYYKYIQGQTPAYGPSFKGFHVSSSVAKSVTGYDARAFQGAADIRLYSYSNGANGYAEGRITAESGLTIAPTTWAVYYNVHGGMAADASHIQRLYIRMRVTTSGGSQRWDSGWAQVFSCSSGTCYHRESWTSGFSVSITVNPTDRIELSFKTVSEGSADMTKSAQFGPYTWPYIGEHFGYVHVGYMNLWGTSTYWWGG